jgi:hypothetical protein
VATEKKLNEQQKERGKGGSGTRSQAFAGAFSETT